MLLNLKVCVSFSPPGWSGHPVCWKRYYFIIRASSCSVDGYHWPCTRCGALLHSLDLRCIPASITKCFSISSDVVGFS